MKKKLSAAFVLLLLIFCLCACNKGDGQSTDGEKASPSALTLKKNHYYLGVGEAAVLDVEITYADGTKSSAKSSEVSAEVLGGGADTSQISGLDMTFSEPGEYSISLKINNTDITATAYAWVYPAGCIFEGEVSGLSETDAILDSFGRVQSGISGADPSDIYAELSSKASAVYDISGQIDFEPMVVLTEDNASLDLKTLTLFKIKRNGVAYSDSDNLSIIGLDSTGRQVLQIFGNLGAQLPQAKNAGYSTIWGIYTGQQVSYNMPRAQYEMMLSAAPDALIFDIDLEFLFFAAEPGNYELTCDVVKSDLSEMLLSTKTLFKVD